MITTQALSVHEYVGSQVYKSLLRFIGQQRPIIYLMTSINNNIPQAELLMEASWEVCNKVGGIYTVLSTKAKQLRMEFGDRLIFIGPDFGQDAAPGSCFLARPTLLKRAQTKLELPYGIKIRTGRWDIPGQPLAVLVSFKGVEPQLNSIFGEMWNRFGVDSLHAYGDYNEGCAFGVASAIVMDALMRHLGADPARCIGHFDEWTVGMGLLYLRLIAPGVATIFTTHATSIGRSICGNGKDLYAYFSGYNGTQMARELNMEAKHSLESTAAREADCFTTVSEITARECAQLLERRPDVVTPNGFESGFALKGAAWKRAREDGRKRLLKVASALCGWEWPEDTFIVATSGRNEYRNKGIDLYIDSMLAAAPQLREKGKKMLALILVPAWTAEPSGALLARLEGSDAAIDSSDRLTHRLHNENTDLIAQRLRAVGPRQKDAGVEFMFVPCYLDGADGVLNIPYYKLLPALDLTVFPSYYEPWGYTPLESIALGVPTVTTDKSGFGRWVRDTFGDTGAAHCGVVVVDRDDSNYMAAAEKIAEAACMVADADEKDRCAMRKGALQTAAAADWSKFIGFYLEAMRVALRNAAERMKKNDNK